MVHLVVTHYVARAMVGPTLDTVKHDCRAMYRSPEDADAAHFADRDWLTSFFSIDGRRVVSLVHSEYDPWTLPGNRCPFKGTRQQANCWWVSVTYALSNDGGYTFTKPPADQGLVAAAPYVWNPQNREGPMGYRGPTNIIQVGTFYYAMVNTFKFPGQTYGPCLMRTTNLLDPKSWRAWNGTDFTVQFINPYVQHLPPEQHTCKSVMAGEVNSLAIDVTSGRYVAMLEAPDRRYGGEPGTYMAASTDLIHWSRPSMVISQAEMVANDPRAGKWGDGYSSILDPLSTDRNFATVTANPYLYYVRKDLEHPPYSRAIIRRRMALRVNG